MFHVTLHVPLYKNGSLHWCFSSVSVDLTHTHAHTHTHTHTHTHARTHTHTVTFFMTIITDILFSARRGYSQTCQLSRNCILFPHKIALTTHYFRRKLRIFSCIIVYFPFMLRILSISRIILVILRIINQPITLWGKIGWHVCILCMSRQHVTVYM